MQDVLVVGDIHLGRKSIEHVRKDKIFESQQAFFVNLISYCSENDISEIIWTGDIFDTQNGVESNIIEYAVELFSEMMGHITHHIVVGNHDIYLKDSLKITSLSCIRKLPNVNVYRKPTQVKILGKEFLMTPYLVSSIKPSFVNNIQKIGMKFDAVVGHFDIIGAKMENGFASEHGLDMSLLLRNIKLLISGHYHNISEYKLNGNVIRYVGTPYQLTFGDSGDVRGFWRMNSDLEMTFIENTLSYNFIKTSLDEIDSLGDLSKSFVKCTYPSNIDDKELFKIVKIIEGKKPISFKTEPRKIESISDMSDESDPKLDEVFNDMCDALNLGNFMEVCYVYLEVEPPKNVKLVKELLLEIKEKNKK